MRVVVVLLYRLSIIKGSVFIDANSRRAPGTGGGLRVWIHFCLFRVMCRLESQTCTLCKLRSRGRARGSEQNGYCNISYDLYRLCDLIHCFCMHC